MPNPISFCELKYAHFRVVHFPCVCILGDTVHGEYAPLSSIY